MSEQFTILVVCLGNVCRSPVAERLLRLRFEELLGAAGRRRRRLAARACAPWSATRSTSSAAAELVRLGGDPSGFTLAPADPARWRAPPTWCSPPPATLRSRVLEEAPRALKRTFTIREFAAFVSADPARAGRTRSTTPAGLVARAASWRGSAPDRGLRRPRPDRAGAGGAPRGRGPARRRLLDDRRSRRGGAAQRRVAALADPSDPQLADGDGVARPAAHVEDLHLDRARRGDRDPHATAPIASSATGRRSARSTYRPRRPSAPW